MAAPGRIDCGYRLAAKSAAYRMSARSAREGWRRASGTAGQDTLRTLMRPSIGLRACVLALVAATFALTRTLADERAAWIALGLTALDPSLIGHASVATVDVPYAAATVLVVWAGLTFAAQPSPGRGLRLGLALGLALLTKFT